MAQVFISYSRKDLAFIEQLASDLKDAGLDVWYDLSGLEGGARWSKEIEKAIRTSQYVIIVVSPDSMASMWVEEEFLLAGELKKRRIPLLYKSCSLPLGYRTLHFIDIQGRKYLQNYKEILRALDIKYKDREIAEKVVLAKAEKEAAEKAARERAEKEAIEKAAREKAEKEAAEKAAREKAEKEAAEKAAKEKAEKEAAEKAAKEKAEREAVEKAAKEKAEKEAAEKAAKEKAEKEAAEKAAKEKAEREATEKAAREKAEKEAAEKATREKAEKEVAEKAAKEKAEREVAKEAAEKAAREKAKKEASKKATKKKAGIGVTGNRIQRWVYSISLFVSESAKSQTILMRIGNIISFIAFIFFILVTSGGIAESSMNSGLIDEVWPVLTYFRLDMALIGGTIASIIALWYLQELLRGKTAIVFLEKMSKEQEQLLMRLIWLAMFIMLIAPLDIFLDKLVQLDYLKLSQTNSLILSSIKYGFVPAINFLGIILTLVPAWRGAVELFFILLNFLSMVRKMAHIVFDFSSRKLLEIFKNNYN